MTGVFFQELGGTGPLHPTENKGGRQEPMAREFRRCREKIAGDGNIVRFSVYLFTGNGNIYMMNVDNEILLIYIFQEK
jgi:hypothetical protein